jgi:hypothetical protein
MRPDIRPGGIFPDYALPDHTNTVRKLSELQGRDPLILTRSAIDFSFPERTVVSLSHMAGLVGAGPWPGRRCRVR